MHSTLRSVTLLCAFMLCHMLPASETLDLKVDKFFSPSAVIHPTLSPDGKHLAYLAPSDKEDTNCLYTMELASGIVRGFKAEKRQSIDRYMWLDNDWLVFNVTVKNIYSMGVYVVKRDDAKSVSACELLTASRILGRDQNNPDQFWVHLIDSISYKDSQLVKYDISLISSRKGELRTTFASKGRAVERIQDPEGGYVTQWIFDQNGLPKIAESSREGEVHYYLIDAEGNWNTLPLNADDWTIHRHANENEVYVTGYGNGETEGLFLYNLITNTLSEPIYRDPEYDLEQLNLVKLKDSQAIAGFQYEGKSLESIWFDPELKQIQTVIDQQFPNTRNRIVSTSEDTKRIVFVCSSPNSPPTYFWYDVPKAKIRKISSTHPSILAQDGTPVSRFRFRTKDSLELEAFFSKPTTALATPSEEKPPLIVLIHGGPWVRDNWSYNTEVQFLTNLGYAVLQVNYRGSSGYGKKISSDNALDFEAMVEDIKTATDLAIQQQWVNPNEIAVMGASFGAYASISLAAKYPDVFQCAVGTAGVYDLADQLESYISQWKHGHERSFAAYHHWKNQIGDPKLQSDYLDSISPLFMANRVACPVFLAHGVNDTTASFSQTRSLMNKLKKNDIEIEKYFPNNEGHGFSNPKNRATYYKKLAAFLAKHIQSNP